MYVARVAHAPTSAYSTWRMGILVSSRGASHMTCPACPTRRLRRHRFPTPRRAGGAPAQPQTRLCPLPASDTPEDVTQERARRHAARAGRPRAARGYRHPLLLHFFRLEPTGGPPGRHAGASRASLRPRRPIEHGETCRVSRSDACPRDPHPHTRPTCDSWTRFVSAARPLTIPMVGPLYEIPVSVCRRPLRRGDAGVGFVL